MKLRVERLDTLEQFAAIGPEWERLEDQSTTRVPFTSLLWNTLWWKHYERTGWRCNDRLRGYAVRDDAGTLVAVAPMMLTARPGAGPLRTRVLQFLGADTNVTELRGLLCRPEDERAVIEAMQEHFSTIDLDWDWIQWRGLRESSAAGVDLKMGRLVPLYQLRLEPTWDELRARLPRNIKESLRKCYNSLKRDKHEFTLEVRSRADESDAAIEQFLLLHSGRSQLTESITHANVFGTDAARHFLTEYAHSMAQRDALRVFQLCIDGKVVATRVGFVLGNTLYLYYSGYDVEWRKYSVMTTLVCEAIKWAIANGFAVVGLSTGNDVSKLRWRPDETMFFEGTLTSPAWRSRLAFRAVEAMRQSRAPVPPAVPPAAAAGDAPAAADAMTD
jgi:CelD/BcsL family acetyltransferase involved in cellulose biosynthesis